ncbi:MAG: hypothetical protein R3255_10055, partial [Candidatus Lokiarchaeia archaeon]|nr:hypothetical protein [Candidatus Lokiarchaeia archaeon]
MRKIKRKDNNKAAISKSDLSRLRRILRLVIYGFSIATLFWYFWSLIGLFLGSLYFIFSKDRAWKRNGIVLAFAIGFITVFVRFYHEIAPLTIVIWFSVIFILSYSIFLAFLEILKRKNISLKKMMLVLRNFERLSNKKRKVIGLIVVFIPITLWTSVSIDLGVMFDNNPRLLWINTPTMANPDETFEVTVEAWDSFERLSAVYKGSVEF